MPLLTGRQGTAADDDGEPVDTPAVALHNAQTAATHGPLTSNILSEIQVRLIHFHRRDDAATATLMICQKMRLLMQGHHASPASCR